MKLILLCAVMLAGCSPAPVAVEVPTRYTNTPTMGDAARAGGEKPF
jgi:hypothetical protein